MSRKNYTAYSERPTLPTKGIPMLILEMLLAIIALLAVGAAFNCIGHLVTK